MNSIEAVIKLLIERNNSSINVSFPAVVVGVQNLKDGFIDVKPLVFIDNPQTMQPIEVPILVDVPIEMPSTKNSTICIPVQQGDFVDLLFHSVDIQQYKNGATEPHASLFGSFGNLSNVSARVGFVPSPQSCYNPSNYSQDFDNQSLNIVHNKGSASEAKVSINTDGDITLNSPTKVVIESEKVEVLSGVVEAKDVNIQGKSVFEFMNVTYPKHTHIGNAGSPTSPPSGV